MDKSYYASFDWYRGNLGWLKDRTVFLGLAGSHAYGTATPESDVDLRGVAIPPGEYFHGFLNHFEQAESKGEPDAVVYDIRKWFELASKCNPNVLELVFADDSSTVISTPYWDEVRAQRDLFLSRQARHTYSGYAIAQLKRIKSHRNFLLNPVEKKPERADFGLTTSALLDASQYGVVDAQVTKQMDTLGGLGWTKDKSDDLLPEVVSDVVRKLELDPRLVQLIVQERRYRSAVREYDQYQKWKSERNPKRAELEAKYGFDSKHASHLCRLLRTCEEVLTTGKLLVKRPDAEELLAIRNGAWTYEQLMEWAATMEARLPALEASSPLPHSPDRKRLDALLVSVVEQYLEANP